VPGESYALETSVSTLTNWQGLATLTVSNGPVSFLDTNAPGNATRFYRLRQ
jgi:hypothetical protein